MNSSDYEKVTIVIRKDIGLRHPKLTMLIGDLHSLPTLKDKIVANEIFIALGTTRSKTPDKLAYYQVDHDYPLEAARLAKANGAKSVFLVTSVGANAASNIFYTKTKGETERDIIALSFQHTHIFRPSLIMGSRKENRPLEKAVQKIWPLADRLLVGKWSKLKGIHGKDVARSMIIAAKNQHEKLKLYHWKEMNDLLRR